MSTEAQYDTTFRNALADLFESDLGASPKLRYHTGTKPANVAASATGTMLVEMTLPSDWMAAASGGVKVKSGTWSGVAAAGSSSIPGYWRMLTSGGTAKRQGSISQAFALTTNNSTAVNSNVLKFASATGVVAGMQVVGTGVPTYNPGTTDPVTVLGVSGGDVTISAPTLSGVTTSTAVYFGDTSGSIWHNGTISAGQTVSLDEFSITAPGA